MGLEAAVVVAVVVRRFLHVSTPSDRLLGLGVVVEVVVVVRGVPLVFGSLPHHPCLVCGL